MEAWKDVIPLDCNPVFGNTEFLCIQGGERELGWGQPLDALLNQRLWVFFWSNSEPKHALVGKMGALTLLGRANTVCNIKVHLLKGGK